MVNVRSNVFRGARCRLRGGNSPDSEQTESLNNDSGSYDSNEEARGNSETTVDLSTLTADYIVQDGYILTGTLRANVKVTIAHGAAVTLKDATIKGVDDNKYRWAGIICAGDATLILKGTNTVRGFYNIYPSIYVPVGRNLTIKGEGSLEASSNGLAAGIGGEYDNACGNIIIDGGTITATGGRNAAGIGGAYYGDCGNITINGGTVIAAGSANASGIGGGYYGKCRNITINGGTVNADGGKYGAGIGGGHYGACGNITINGGTITAAGSDYAAGIGGGEASKCGSITIDSNVISVTATKGSKAKHSIGDGRLVRSGTVTIGGFEEKITESPYTYAPVNLSRLTDSYTVQDGEILAGTLNANVKVSIADRATVRLRSVKISGTNSYSCRWAGLSCEGDATIILDCSNDVKGFYYLYPGIHVPEGKTLTITGSGDLTARSNGWAAGIGGGMSIPCGNIVIDGGSITAIGGTNSAAIGGGVFSKCGTITITKNTERVAVTKGDDTPYSIGAGKEGTCGTVTIDGVEGAIAMSSYTYQLVDLSTISADYTVYGVRPLSGALGVNVNISIADGSAVILRDATIDVEHSWSATWAGLNCKGDATIILDGSNTVKSCNIYCPGIHIPEGYTLTIKGKGSLTALAHPGDYGES